MFSAQGRLSRLVVSLALLVALPLAAPAGAQPAVTSLLPADHALLASRSGTLTGRAAGAALLRVDGHDLTLGGDGSFSYAFSLPEGESALTIYAEDEHGAATSLVHHLEVDSLAPGIVVGAPAQTRVAASPVEVAGTVQEAHLAGVTVRGSPATLSGNSFSSSVSLAEGAQNVAIVATDSLGRSSTVTLVLTLDTQAPSIAVSEAGVAFFGGLFKRPVAPFITIGDAGSFSSEILLDGSPYVSGTSISTEGAHQLEVTATDAVGNSSSREIDFTLDFSAPSFGAISPAAGSLVAASTVTLQVEAAGATSVKVGSQQGTASGNVYTIGPIGLAEGSQELLIEAFDAAGNRAERAHALIRDTTAPALSIVAPAQNAVLTTSPVTISGIATDPRLASVRVGGDLASLSGPNFSISKALAEGANSFQVEALDTAGNSSSQTLNLTLDTTAPSFTVKVGGVALAGGEVFSAAITPTIELSEPAASVTATLDGASFTFGGAISADGNHQLAVTVTHNGLSSSNLFTFRIDRQAPVFGALLPAEGSVLSAATVLLEGTLTGAAGLTVDGAAVTVTGSTFAAGPYPLAAGASRTFVLLARSAGGLTTERRLTVVQDATAPQLAIQQPAENALIGAATVAVSGTASDPHLLRVRVSGVDAQLSASSWLASAVSLAEGSNTLTVVAEDRAGNQRQLTRSVVRDTTDPELTVTEPAAGTVVPAAAYTIRGTATDAHLDRVEIAGRRATLAGSGFSLEVALVEGANAFEVVAIDRLGRRRTASVSITRDSQAPQVLIVEPAEGFATRAASILVRGAYENETGTTVKVNGINAVLASGHFEAAAVPLVPGENRITARAVDVQGNAGVHTRLVVRDEVAPTFVGLEPASGALALPLSAVFRISFSEEMAPPAEGAITLATAAGTPLAFTAAIEGKEMVIDPVAPLPAQTTIRLTLTAGLEDRAGNHLTPVPAAFEMTTVDTGAPGAPVLTATPPATGCRTRVELAGTAEAESQVKVTGGAAAAFARADETGAFVLEVELLAEQASVLHLTATDALGNVSPELLLSLAADCTPPQVADAQLAGAVVTVEFTEPVTALATAFGLSSPSGAETFSFALAGDTATLTLAAPPAGLLELAVGETGAVADLAGNELAFPWRRLFGAGGGDSFIAGTVFDDGRGQPLEGVIASVTSTNGIPLADPLPRVTTTADGRFLLGLPAGTHDVTFARPGYSPVFRVVTTAAGEGTHVFDPRLTLLSLPQPIGAAGGQVSSDGARLEVPAGAFATSQATSITALSEQALPSLLPYGFSPRGAVYVNFDATLSTPGTLTLPVETANGREVVIASLDFSLLQWKALAVATVAGADLEIEITEPGTYVVVEADAESASALTVVVGQVLPSLPAPAGDEIEAAEVDFSPTQVLPSQRSRATVSYSLKDAGTPAPSGLPLTLAVQERLTLLDGSERRAVPYSADLLVFRAPDGEPRSRFWLQPSPLAASLPIEIGAEDVTLRTFGETTVRGNILGPDGGSVLGAEGDLLEVPAGALTRPTAVTVKRRTVGDLPHSAPAGFPVLGVLEVDLGGVPLAGVGRLTLATAEPPAAGSRGLLLGTEEIDGQPRWRAIAELEPSSAGWRTVSSGGAHPPWPGVSRGGLYLAIELEGDWGLLEGELFDTDQELVAGGLISSAAVPWIQLSNSGGTYVIPLPAGSAVVVAARDGRHDQVSVEIPALADLERRVFDLEVLATGPTVVEIEPADASANVPTTVLPRVVFSESVDRATLEQGIRLTRAGEAVAVEIDHQDDRIVIDPVASLLPDTTYTLEVGTEIADLQGRLLTTPRSVSFHTTAAPPPSPGIDASKLRLYEPDFDGVARVVGLPGAVPAGSTMWVEGTETVTVVADETGRFELELEARVGDAVFLTVLVPGQSAAVQLLGPWLIRGDLGAWVPNTGGSFETAAGVDVTVEPGTFEALTRVELAARPAPIATAARLSVVLDFELDLGGAVARRPILVRMPAPSANPPGATYLLSRYVEALGRRGWMVMDLLRRDGGSLTNAAVSSVAGSSVAAKAFGLRASRYEDPAARVLASGDMEQIRAGAYLAVAGAELDRGPGVLEALAPRTALQPKSSVGQGVGLVGLRGSGRYQVAGASSPVSWLNIPAVGQLVALSSMNDGPPFLALSLDQYLNEHVPNLTLPRFGDDETELEVIDLGTGYTVFEGVLPPSPDPVMQLPPDVVSDHQPPVLVGGSPLRFQLIQTVAEGEFDLGGGMTAEISGISLRVRGAATAAKAGAQIKLYALDADREAETEAAEDGSFEVSIQVPEQERILLAVGGKIGPSEKLKLTFNEQVIELQGVNLFPVEGGLVSPEPLSVRKTAIDQGVSWEMVPATGWQAGEYRLRIGSDLRDGAGNAWPRPFELKLTVPRASSIASIEIPRFSSFDRIGNVLAVAGNDGGLRLFDVSNPADPAPFMAADQPYRFAGGGAIRGVRFDRHGRAVVVGSGEQFAGQMHVLDVLALDREASDVTAALADGVWGYTSISNRLNSTSPVFPANGLARRVAILNADDRHIFTLDGEDELPAGVAVTTSPSGTPGEDRVTFLGGTDDGHAPVSIHNHSRGRWQRTYSSAAGNFEVDILAQPGDTFELVRSKGAWAYATIGGFGLVGVKLDDIRGGVGSDLASLAKARFTPGYNLGREPVCDPNRPLTDPSPIDLQALNAETNAEGAQPASLVTLVQGFGLVIYQINTSDPRQMVALSTACAAVDRVAVAAGMEVVTNYGFDLDADGVIRNQPQTGPDGQILPSELRDYAVLAHAAGWVMIFDITERAHPFLAGRVQIGRLGQPVQISGIAIDRLTRRIYVGAFGSGLYVVDFDSVPWVGNIDSDRDQLDDRVTDNIQIGSEEFVDTLAMPEIGIVWAGGRRIGVSSIAVAGPQVKVVAADGGPTREIRSIAPFGVPTAPEGGSSGASQPAVFEVQAVLASGQAEIPVQVAGVGPGGSPIDSAGEVEDIPTPQVTEMLRRQADNPWERGANSYISKRVAAIADLRASVTYEASEEERAVCARCSQVEQGVYSGVPEPSQRLKEVLSGKQISVDFTGGGRDLMTDVYSDLLGRAVEVKSVPWQPSPSITQEPPQNVVTGSMPGALLHSGELAAREIDLETPSRNASITFERAYRSQTVGAGPLGPGWDHNFNVRLRELPTGDVELFDGAGRRDLFTRLADGSFETPAGRFEALTKSSSGFNLADPAKTQLQFDVDGRLQKVKDALSVSAGKGNEVQLTYDGKSRLKTIQDAQDKTITLDYDDQGRLEKLRDHSGRSWDYGYDAKGQLITVKTPPADLGTGVQRLEKSYSYSPTAGSDVRERLNQHGQLAAVKKPDGQTWLSATFTDADGDGLPEEIQSQQLGTGSLSVVIDKAARLATVTDLRGNVSKYNFNAAGQPSRFEDPTGAVWQYEYNGDGLVTKVTEPLGRVTDYLYATGADARVRANLIETRVTADSRGVNGSPETLVAQTSYDPVSNKPSRMVDPRGNVTSILRSPEGLPLQILRGEGTPEATSESFVYNDFGQVLEHVDGDGRKTAFIYYADGPQAGFLQKKVVDPGPGNLNLTTTYDVDELGRVRAITDGRGVRSEIDYNDLGWKIATRQATTGAADGSAPPLGYETRWQYDENGNVLLVEIPYGDGSQHTLQSFEYGPLNELRVIRRQIEPRDPQLNWIAEPANWITETRTYDANLNLIATVDGEGHRQEVDYDERNLPEIVTRGLGVGALAAPIVESFVYDAERQLRIWVDGRGKQWEQLYDGYARPAEQRDPLGNTSKTEYDPNGNPVAQRLFDAQGELLARGGASYDSLDRRFKATQYLWDPQDPLAVARPLETRFVYDRVGNVRTVTDALGRTSERRYDAAGRLYEALDPLGNRQVFTFDPASNVAAVTQHDLAASGPIATTTTFGYDALGREVLSTDALGNKVQSAYDARHQLVQVIDQENHFTTFGYDGLGRQVRETRPEGIEIFRSYDKASRLTEYRDAKNQRTTYAYDAVGRQTGITYPDQFSESFAYDPGGNLVERVDQLGNQIASTYDDANRLISRTATPISPEVQGPYTETYTWDGLGRLGLAQSGSIVTERRFDSLSRLVEESTNGRLVRYELNDAGLPEATIYPSGFQVDRDFDALNRPQQISHDNALIGLFQYRGPGAVEKTTYGNGLVRETTFDALTRPLSSTVGKIDLPAVFSEQTVWTPRSLKAGVARADQNGFGKVFQYDGAGRVLGVARRPSALFGLANNTVPTGDLIASAPEAENFEYDAAQNLLRSKERKNETETTVETPPDVSGRNRPASIGGRELEWDANGNLRKKDNLRFAYDWRNRLKKVTRADNGDLVAIYSYDVFNRRVKKEVGGQTYGYAWDGWNQIEDSLNGPSEVRNRRVYGLGLDNALRMDFDLNGSGGPDVQYVPVYDGIGNLVALTNAAGKPIERYEYSAYGKQRIFVDGTPPQINQIRKVGSTFFIEMSEEVSLVEIQRQIAEGHIKLVGTGVGGTYGLTATQPIQEGPLARRRIALTTGATIAASQEVTLTIGAETLVDSFLNAAPGTANVHTFDWETEGILEDNNAPSVERVAVRAGRIEIDFDETVDATLAAQAITVDGGVVAWTLASSGYRMVADVALAVGSHAVEISTGAVDLASKGLATGVEHEVTVGTEAYASVFEAPNAREVSSSTANNPFGFHGLPIDSETGFSYIRNRYYDAEQGRFVSPDPLSYVDGPSMYSFAGFNPGNVMDPLGLQEAPQSPVEPPLPCSLRAYCEEASETEPAPEEPGWFERSAKAVYNYFFGDLEESARETEHSIEKAGDHFSDNAFRKPGYADADRDDNAVLTPSLARDRIKPLKETSDNVAEVAKSSAKTTYHAIEAYGNAKVVKEVAVATGLAVVAAVKDKAEAEANRTVRRWMSRGEYEALVKDGKLAPDDAGGKYILNEGAPLTEVPGAVRPGSVLVEFEIPAGTRTKVTNAEKGWENIYTKDSIHGRNDARKSNPAPSELPAVQNPRIVAELKKEN